MVSEIQKNQLQALLSQLSEGQVEKLVSVMDVARNEKAMSASSDLIMSMLRPSLLRTKPRRLQTPLRILCDPFEDFLGPPKSGDKEITKIARTSIAPMWDWLQEIGGDAFAKTCDAFVKATNDKDEERQWIAACAIWVEAEKLIRPEITRAYSDGKYNSKLAKKLGHSDRIDDLREMLELIQIGAIVEGLKKDLPAKPILKMSQKDIGLIKKSYIEASENKPGSEVWLIISVMYRLLHEAEILKVIKSLSRAGNDTLASMTDLSLVGDLVIGEVEGYITMIKNIVEQKNSDLDVMEIAKNYMSSFSQVTSNLDIKREGDWGRRMLTSRNNLGAYISEFILKDGTACVMGGFSMAKRKMGKITSMVIDLRHAPDIEKYKISERRAKAIKDCSGLADRIGLKSASQAVVNELNKELEKFEDKLIDILDRVTKEENEIATKHVIMLARIQEILMGADTADLFRKRALGILKRSHNS